MAVSATVAMFDCERRDHGRDDRATSTTNKRYTLRVHSRRSTPGSVLPAPPGTPGEGWGEGLQNGLLNRKTRIVMQTLTQNLQLGELRFDELQRNQR